MMLELTEMKVYNIEDALRGMRNPLDSWDQSDSSYKLVINIDSHELSEAEYEVGPRDMKLAQNLRRAGTDHRKYLRQILVSVDINGPLYWWKEFDTYKVGTVANSCSTMHTIHKGEIEASLFSTEHLAPLAMDHFERYLALIEKLRVEYLIDKDKKIWNQIIQLLPTNFNQKRTVTLNYEVILSIYHARKNHKLEEWHEFCRWAERLPYFEEMCLA